MKLEQTNAKDKKYLHIAKPQAATFLSIRQELPCLFLFTTALEEYLYIGIFGMCSIPVLICWLVLYFLLFPPEVSGCVTEAHC